MWKILLFRLFRIPVVGISNGRMQALYSHVETFKNFTRIITFSFVFGEHVHKYYSQHLFEKGWRYYAFYNTMNFVLFFKTTSN